MRGAPALVVLCGCRGILGIHDVDNGPPDVRGPDSPAPDGSFDPDTPNLCPSDFMTLPGGTAHRYKLLVGDDNYLSQANDCEAAAPNTYLAIPDDQQELLAMLTVAQTTCWVGIDDRVQENTFVTAKGVPATFLPWANGQPNDNLGGEDCVEALTSMQFNDTDCNANLPAICECEP
jgi:hypothetical protein